MEARKRVAWNVRRLRVGAGLTQEALAHEAGLDVSYIGRIERGTQNPSIAALEKLAVRLSVDILDLLAIPEADAPPPASIKPGRRR
ncbi:helix-turn-helix domain-containing protein [Kaistia sp. MMO-174]|uniref:helix-turn-helix domain-containing protein n=1 Tax=Kaistia sp. MMO-174 TaxID=3081256 RepID=UPI003017D04F